MNTPTQTNTINQILNGKNLSQALLQLEQDIRRAPADTNFRLFLFQLLCVLGHWKRALGQLQVLAKLNAEFAPFSLIYGELIRAEIQRGKVLYGSGTPSFLEAPLRGASDLVSALNAQKSENIPLMDEQRFKAFDDILDCSGILKLENGSYDFEWISNMDTRFGSSIEVMCKGRYFWLAFENIKKLELLGTQTLRDLIWAPAVIHLKTGQQTHAFLPARYCIEQQELDDQHYLGRVTSWRELGNTGLFGTGQVQLTTSIGEFGLLQLNTIEFKDNKD